MKKILVIDDDDGIRNVAVRTLHKCGYEVLEAADGRNGLELARHRLPDLVLSDIRMSEVDGYAVLDGLRSQPVTSAIPVILMSGANDGPDIRSGMERGADDYLVKPFTAQILLEAVQARLDRQHTIQAKAKEKEALLLEILSASRDLVAMSDAKTRRLFYLNQAGRRLLGIGDEEDISGLRLEDFEVNAPNKAVGNGRLPEAKTQSVWTGESAFLGRQGRYTPVLKQILAHYSPDGQIAYLSIVASDITERKRMDEALQQNEKRYRELVNGQGEGVVYSDAELQFTFANPAAESLLGVWPGQLVGKKLGEFLDEKNKLIVQQQQKLRQNGEKSSYEIEITSARGERRQILVTATPQMDAEGRFCGTFAVFRDITQRKRAEQAVRENQRLLRAILDNIPDPAWLKDASGRYRVGNKPLARIYHRKLEDIVGKTVFEAFPAGATGLVEGDRQAASSGEPVRSENCVPDGDGGDRWFDTIETPILDEQGQVTGIVGIARDITERKQSETALRESEARYRSLFENMLGGFAHCRIIYDGVRPQDFVYLEVNAVFEKLTGLKNVTGRKVSEVIPGIHETNPELIETYGRVASTGKSEKIEVYVNALEIWFSIAIYSHQKEHFVAVFDNITERKRTEEALRQKTALFEAMVNSSPDGILVVNEQSRKVIQNPQFTGLIRIPPEIAEESDDARQLQFVTDSVRDPEQFLAKVLHLNAHPEETSHDEIEFKDGRILDRHSAPVRDHNGKYYGRIWMFRDITERKRAEEKLHLQSSALTAAANGIVITDHTGVILWVNPAFTRLTGYDSSEAIGKTPALLKSGVHDQSVYQNLWNTITSGKVWQGEMVNRRKDGNRYHEEMTITPVLDECGEILNFVAVKQDVSHRKQAEEQLAYERDLFQVLMNNLPDNIYFKDRESRLVRASKSKAVGTLQAVRDSYRATHPDTGPDAWPAHLAGAEAFSQWLVGKTDFDTYPEAHARAAFEDEQAIMRTGRPIASKIERAALPNGQTIWWLAEKMPWRNHAGEIIGTFGISKDITARRWIDEALARINHCILGFSEDIQENLQQMINLACELMNASCAVYWQVTDGTLNRLAQYHVPAPDRLTRRPTPAFMDKLLTDLESKLFVVHDLPGASSSAELADFGLGGFQTWMGVPVRIDWTVVNCLNLFYQNDQIPTEGNKQVMGIIAAALHLLEQRQKGRQERQTMELQLRQAQKMEAVGQLAAGIAHEINTPTQYVGDNTRFLKDAFDDISRLLRSHGEVLTAAKQNALTPEILGQAEEVLAASDLEYLFDQIPRAISETLEGVERVTKIVRAMKDFSHPGGKEKTAADLNKAIESTTTVARNEWKYVADLKLDLAPDLPLVPCLLGEFNQAILNLVINAAHAIDDVVKQNPGTKGLITLRTRRDGDQAEIRVSDTGTGIAEIHRSHIFEPFFTTKDVGKGTGQGLTVVYSSIVKKHGGTVTFETETGKGTTFIIRLPINSGNPADTELNGGPRSTSADT